LACGARTRDLPTITITLAGKFPAIRKRYWGCHFWARGYFSTTSSNITDDVILQYLYQHIQPTGVSR
jgi:putative transposase